MVNNGQKAGKSGFSHSIHTSGISRSSSPNDSTFELSLVPQEDTALVGLIWLFIYLLLGYQTVIQSILVYGAEVWLIPTREINEILSTKMDVLRRSARKLRMERIKNEHIKETVGVKRKPHIIDTIEKKRQWYGHIKRMPEETIPKLIMECIPWQRRKRGC